MQSDSRDINTHNVIQIKIEEPPQKHKLDEKSIVEKQNDNLVKPKNARAVAPKTVPVQRLDNYDSMQKVLSSVKLK